MEFVQEVGIFLVEAIILVSAIIAVLLALAAISQRRKGGEDGYIEVRRLNDRYTAFHDAVRGLTEHAEQRKQREKAAKKAARKSDGPEVDALEEESEVTDTPSARQQPKKTSRSKRKKKK